MTQFSRMMKTRIIRLMLIFIIAAGAFAAQTGTVTVIAEGKAAGDMANMREQALVDALREAVRKGAGTDVLSSTKVKDFVMEYDRVLASAFGYVRNYTVLEAGLGNDEIYRVKIRAEVGEGNPDVKDKMALQMIVRSKGSPRVALEVDELIEGIPAGSEFAKAWFEQAIRDMQIHLVDVKRAGRNDDKLAVRDAFLGDDRTSSLRKLDIAQDADFILKVRVRGEYAGSRETYDIPLNIFSFSVDLSAIRPDTGALLVSIPLKTVEKGSSLASKSGAARQLLHNTLDGDLEEKDVSAWVVFRKIFAHWLAELDMGTVLRLEFKQITNSEYDKIQKTLSGTPKITSVWPREFDSRGLSFIDVETRLESSALNRTVTDGLDGAFVADRFTKHYLQFIRKPAGQ